MDAPDHDVVSPGRPRPRVIGVIGRTRLSEAEHNDLRFIGQCIAAFGHTLAYVPAKGTADAVREGAEAEAGETLVLDAGVIDKAEHTLVYPDKRLLYRLLVTYPDFHARANVTVITPAALSDWADAAAQLLKAEGLPIPAR
jgi:hypothetical protein